MPVDTSANSVEWYMTTNEDMQIVRLRWVPAELPIVSSMTMGKMTLEQREWEDKREGGGEITDEWLVVEGFNKVVADAIPYVVAQNIARGQGFTVEVTVK